MDIEFEDTKGITRSCNPKDRQYNDQKTKDNKMGKNNTSMSEHFQIPIEHKEKKTKSLLLRRKYMGADFPGLAQALH